MNNGTKSCLVIRVAIYLEDLIFNLIIGDRCYKPIVGAISWSRPRVASKEEGKSTI